MTIDRNWLFDLLLKISIIFMITLLLSSGAAAGIFGYIFNETMQAAQKFIGYHFYTLQIVDARHYFLFSNNEGAEFYLEPFSPSILFRASIGALLNVLLQPAFLCFFTPQAVLSLALLPFFIYGCIKYFRKVPFMILGFFLIAIYIGINGSVVEALIRHRISCELIYFLVGLAGFTALITESLS